MRFHVAAASVVCLLAAACGEPGAGAPVRPETVPATARWAGGPDGGAWLDCHVHDRAASKFRCTAYADGTGAVSAEGEFVLARSHWDEVRKKASFERVGNPPSALGYIAFDGETLYLVDSMVLVPGGVISYR